MPDWQDYLRRAQGQARRVPKTAWAAAGVIAVSLAVVLSMEMDGPRYVPLYDGLSPADGGKVIAELQKLGIPYELQAAGNIISVPAPQLAEARLELGAAEVPQGGVSSQWDKLENAPMTASDLAQNTMAAQALEASLEQSIEGMNGIRSAQVYLALPADTPFLADQPKPTASVVITADQADAQAQGAAIANLVAGAVPGLSAQQVSVETTSGVAVYPAGDQGTTTAQFATVTAVENSAASRIALLLTPLVGAGNFRTDVSANLSFTQERIHKVSYGPSNIVTHQISKQSDQVGSQGAAIGIPGALSNEPPAATTAATPPIPAPGAANATTGAAGAAAGAAQAQPATPRQTSKDLDQTYVTDQTDSDIIQPDWSVKSVAVSVVVNKAALGTVSTDSVKAAIAGAFAYPQVSVNVLAVPFRDSGLAQSSTTLMQAVGPVSHALFEVLAAAALLFGVALPLGRQLGRLAKASPPLAPRPVPVAVALPGRDFSSLRDKARENPTSVAQLLQSWAEDSD
jgi:flagellar M-ring protein FliF